MAAPSRHWLLAGLILATLACMACNPLTLPYFIFVGPDPKHDPEFKLEGEEKRKPVKVIVLVSTGEIETRRELANTDRELNALFTHKLQESCKKNKENVILASTSKIQRFKDDHPGWQSLPLQELGKRLDADYVIDLDINRLSLFEPGSQNTLLQGRASISVKVAQVRKGEDNPVFTKDYVIEYPRSGARPASETDPYKFRRDFLGRIATDLTWLFTAHPSSEHWKLD